MNHIKVNYTQTIVCIANVWPINLKQFKQVMRTAWTYVRSACDCGLRTADCGLRTADCGLRTADCGLDMKGASLMKGRCRTYPLSVKRNSACAQITSHCCKLYFSANDNAVDSKSSSRCLANKKTVHVSNRVMKTRIFLVSVGSGLERKQLRNEKQITYFDNENIQNTITLQHAIK